MKNEEYVIKRNGEKECISFDKILTRVKKLLITPLLCKKSLIDFMMKSLLPKSMN